MEYILKRTLISAIIIGLFTSFAVSQNTKDLPSQEEIKKIENAVPKKTSALPKKPRKVLVFSDTRRFYHSSIPYCKEAIYKMGEKTGAFSAVISDDLFMFESENLKKFDVVFLNNSCYEIFLPENFNKLPEDIKKTVKKRDKRLKENLKNFIKSGKGLALIHAGLGAFLEDWQEFEEIIGAAYDNHPWNTEKIFIKIDDPSHPVNRAFIGKNFSIIHEIYQVKEPYSRKNLHVLISIDTDKTNMNVEGVHRKDNDFALSWVKNYGKGKVFYCVFGSDPENFWNETILQHYLDGIQYVMGDLR